MNYSCLIIDDEPLAAKVIARYLEKIPDMNLKAVAHNAFEALEKLNQYNIDLIFLDIDMPEISGLDLVKSLHKRPSFIFVTAYRQYAAEAFDVDAIDYLLKPVSFPRFLKAINKFQALNNEAGPAAGTTIQIRADRITHKIKINSIALVEGLKDYVKIYCTDDKVFITHKTMSAMEEELQPFGFLRCHKSFLISMNRIKSFTADYVMVDKRQIPVGKSYKKSVYDFLSAK